MLEKKSNIICDAHLHLSCTKNFFNELSQFDFQYFACSTAHSITEWQNQNIALENKNINIINAFGIHPQSLSSTCFNIEENLLFLEKLLESEKNEKSSSSNKEKVYAIGETGFDFFTNEFSSKKEMQEELFITQIMLAIKYNKPVIIHCRKANEKLFEHKALLKKVPAVLFHSFMGSLTEAQSLIKKGINAYFSFGKQMLNGNKKVIECVKNLPLSNLLCETDAPYQTLKNEKHTKLLDIKTIYQAFYALRNTDGNYSNQNLLQLDNYLIDEMHNTFFENFKNLFML